MTTKRMIELLAFERKCVELADECDRNCAECNLVQDTNELLDMYNEVISLLKAQEPIQIIKVGYYDHGRCPKCDRYVSKYSNFCWYCGQAVKWK